MKARCNDPKHDSYHLYGGAGIKICDEWVDFWVFANDMGDPPTKRHTVDRIDYTQGYSKGNCKWSTPAEQSRNMSSNVWIEANGKRLTVFDWAKLNGASERTYYGRIRCGWDLVDVVTIPVRRGLKYIYRKRETVTA